MEQISEIRRFLINCICEKYIKMAFLVCLRVESSQ